MATVTKPIALDESFNTTELTPRNIADVLAQELSRITGRNASQVEYDNTESGLTADNVQDALDEIVEDIPTVPSVDIQTAVDEFSTYNGGLLSSLKVSLSPNQDLHGYSEPWVGGAGKNKLPLVLADIKSINTSGTWSGNRYTFDNGTIIDVLTDDDDNVLGFKASGSNSATGQFFFYLGVMEFTSGVSYILNGITGGSNSTYRINVQGISNYTGGENTISGDGASHNVRINIMSGTNYPSPDFTVNPMIRLSTESDPTFEPYSNICPISGHTQVDVDVSDGDTTQEQVTVNLGGTYYSGTLDVVTGVFTPDTAEKEYDGTEQGWTTRTTAGGIRLFEMALTPTPKYSTPSEQMGMCNELIWNLSLSSEYTYRIYSSTLSVHVADSITSLADFYTWLGNNPLQITYPVASPQTVQLSPTMVKALVGENHLSAPLDGQEITESKYKQMFTFDDVIAYIQSLS